MLLQRLVKILSPSTVIIAGLIASPSQAHTPYLAPTSFEPVMGNMVSFDASFAEAFFVPEAAFNNSVFKLTSPDGTTSEPDQVVAMKTRVVIEHKLEQEGTYRLSTGARMGAVFVIYELDGKEKRAMDPTEALPKGAKIKHHFQSITRADTYISRKNPSDGALKVEAQGYQILPISNPNELFADEQFQLKILLDGKAMAAQEIKAYAANGSSKPQSLTFSSDANGLVTLKLGAGKYLLRARYRGPAPKGAKAPTYSHTTTLSLQVFENI